MLAIIANRQETAISGWVDDGHARQVCYARRITKVRAEGDDRS